MSIMMKEYSNHRMGAAAISPDDIPKAAMPVTFSGTPGLFMPADNSARASQTAVLLLSPWGYEEMCTRKFYRMIAEDLASSGMASLRFDYPGIGDALDPADGGSLALWRDTITTGAQTLRALTGLTDLIVIGQGLGAALAYETAATIGNVAGLALMAPVLSGRSYLRELSVWARMTEGKSEEEQKVDGGFSVGGLKLSEKLVNDIRAINLNKAPLAPAQKILVAERTARPQDADFAAHMKTLGAEVETLPYERYDELVSNLTFSKPPQDVVDSLVAWARDIRPNPVHPPVPATLSPEAAPLSGDGFTETPMRFGENNRLYGILCEPADGIRRGATVVMLTTAYERMSGWGRVATETARDMARSGIASLRFDAANAADSPPLPGAPNQILYSDAQYLDVDAAMEVIVERNLLPAIVTGRCSGGYLAFRAAVRDDRFSGAVAANPYVFYWDGSESIEELMLFVPQQLTSYAPKVFKLDTWRRIMNGEVNLKHGVINTLRVLQKRSLRLAGPLLEIMPNLSREHHEVYGAFQTIHARNTELSLMYSEDDVGLEHFTLHFGNEGEKLDRFPNARLTMIPDADHSLTTTTAREIYGTEVKGMALKFPPAV